MPRKKLNISDELYHRLDQMRVKNEDIDMTLNRLLTDTGTDLTSKSEDLPSANKEPATNYAFEQPQMEMPFDLLPPSNFEKKLLDKERRRRRYWKI